MVSDEIIGSTQRSWSVHNVVYFLSGFLAFFISSILCYLLRRRTLEDNFPAVGSTYPMLSYIGAVRFIWDAKGMVQEGYDAYNGGLFRVAEINRWNIIATSEYAEEIRNAPEDIMSAQEAVKQQLQVQYTLGKEIYEDHYHISTIRSELTRNIKVLFHEVRDELVQAFSDEFVLDESAWTRIKPLASLMRVVSRAGNRVFVGLPKCRDPEYRDLNVRFTTDTVMCFTIMNLFPSFFRPVVGCLLSKLPRNLAVAIKHITPLIDERRRLASVGCELPNDMLSWFMANQNRAMKHLSAGDSIKDLAIRILAVNFSANHTTSTALTHAVYDLAAIPQYITPLREEIEGVITQEGGWSKTAVDKMVKLDSFLRESLRMNGISILSSTRKAMKDFVFRDGTRISAGSFVSIPSTAIHFDNKLHTHAANFDGFRFSNMRADPGNEVKHQAVTTSLDYVVFGHGRGACPGRFFASNELKCALAHIVLSYDVKTIQNGVRPKNKWYGAACVPDPNAEILFRRRAL